jgi:hypothetical protein
LILRDVRAQIPYAAEQGNQSDEQGDKTDDQGIKSAEHGKAPQVSSGRLPRPRALARRLPAAVAGREAIGDLRAKTAIEPAHRRQGEVLVLLGTNFDNPPAVRSFGAGDEHHFSVWSIADVTTFEGCAESAVRA